MHFSCSLPDKTGVMCVFPCTLCETRMLNQLLKVKLSAKGYCPKVSPHHIQDTVGASVLPPLPLSQARPGFELLVFYRRREQTEKRVVVWLPCSSRVKGWSFIIEFLLLGRQCGLRERSEPHGLWSVATRGISTLCMKWQHKRPFVLLAEPMFLH